MRHCIPTTGPTTNPGLTTTEQQTRMPSDTVRVARLQVHPSGFALGEVFDERDVMKAARLRAGNILRGIEEAAEPPEEAHHYGVYRVRLAQALHVGPGGG